MDSRQRMDVIKERLANTRGFSKLMDAVYECISNQADAIAEDTGYEREMVHIALQEMVGIVEEYSADEIDAEVADSRKE